MRKFWRRIIAEQPLEWNSPLYIRNIKSLWQSQHIMEDSLPLQNTRKIHLNHTAVILRLPGQSDPQWRTRSTFYCDDRCSPGLHLIMHALSFGRGLGHRTTIESSRTGIQWTLVSQLLPGFYRWYSPPFPQLPTCTGESTVIGYDFNIGSSQDQKKQDLGDAN